MIKESNSGYVCNAGDYKKLANLIIKMSKLSKRERKKLGLNGINYSKIHFNKKILLGKLDRLIKQIYKK